MVNILDTTIRDGSYIVNFKWSIEDIQNICGGLDSANIPFIEIGHGLGLGAYRKDKLKSSCTDIDQFEIANQVIKKNKWGMFFIPEYGDLSDIDLAISYGMNFIRIGTNVTDLNGSNKYIDYAKSKGLFVFSNLMKTYVMSPSEVAKRVKHESLIGADVVSIVDSAGGMLPENIDEYYKHIRAITNIPLGFHGHNNLGLANSNALKAIDCGFNFIDTTLRGLGRSAGNASTEQLLLILQKRKDNANIDAIYTLSIAEKYIDPILKYRHLSDSISMISGFAEFHSSNMDLIDESSIKYGINPKELIIRVSEIEKVNLTFDLTRKVAESLEPTIDNMSVFVESIPKILTKTSENDIEDKISAIIDQVSWKAQRIGTKSIVNLVKKQPSKEKDYVSTNIYSGSTYTIVSIEFSRKSNLDMILEKCDNKVDYVMIDIDHDISDKSNWGKYAIDFLNHTKVMLYSDSEVWAKNINRFLIEYLSSDESDYKIIIVSNNNKIVNKCREFMETVGIRVITITGTELTTLESSVLKNAVLLFFNSEGVDIEDLSDRFDGIQFVVDCLIGSVSDSLLKIFFEKGITVYRPDMRTVLHDEALYISNHKYFIQNVQGIKYVENITITAGGIVAPYGTIVVDKIKDTTSILGIADGKGRLIDEYKYSEDEYCLIDVARKYYFEGKK